MRITSSGTVPRLDLAPVHRLVPALWDEWRALRFDAGGHLIDPDTGRPLSALTLTGRHRTPGARYLIAPAGPRPATFTYTSDDGGTLRGVLATDAWSADVRIGPQPAVTARMDVRMLLERNEVPGWAIGLIGGGPATADVTADPALLDRDGDVLVGAGGAQRAAGTLTVHAVAHRDTWDGRIVVRLHGRGLLGRVALLAGRAAVRRALGQALEALWPDLVRGTTPVQQQLAGLDDRLTAAGGPAPWLHAQLWTALRTVERATPRTATPAAPADAPAPETPRTHGLGRRYNREVLITAAPADVPDTLHVKQRHDRVRAHLGTATRASSPPAFRGQLEQRDGATVLAGRIRESPASGLLVTLYRVLAVWMLLIAAFGVAQVARHGFGTGSAPLVVGLLGSLLFALIARLLGRNRARDFTRAADALSAALGEWLRGADRRSVGA